MEQQKFTNTDKLLRHQVHQIYKYHILPLMNICCILDGSGQKYNIYNITATEYCIM